MDVNNIGMNKLIKKFKKEEDILKHNIKINLKIILDVDYENTKTKTDKYIEVIELCSEKDIDNVKGSGFYIILTDYDVGENNCSFKYGNLKAIYRGHSSKLKGRIKSHLANGKYKEEGGTYETSLKIEDGVNGINIDSSEYSRSKWMVIIHKMTKSSKLMREQAESAFDELYKQPACSKD